MARVYNFSPGPSMLPAPVLEKAQAELREWHSTGVSVMEMSHRGNDFVSIAEKAEADLRELLAVPGDYKVDTGGEFGDGRKSRALRHFDSRMRMSLRESRRFLIDNLSFHLILQSMDGHVTSIAPNRPDS